MGAVPHLPHKTLFFHQLVFDFKQRQRKQEEPVSQSMLVEGASYFHSMHKGGRDMKMTIKILFNNSLLLVSTRKALSEVNIKINDIKKLNII